MGQQATKEAFGGMKKPDVSAILRLLARIRALDVAHLRDIAGLQEGTASKIRSKFHTRADSGRPITVQEFEKHMHELFKNVKHQPVERERIRKIIKDRATD